MKKLTLLSLVGTTSIALAHAGWAAGHGGGGGGGFGGSGFHGGGGLHGGGFGGGGFRGGGLRGGGFCGHLSAMRGGHTCAGGCTGRRARASRCAQRRRHRHGRAR